MDRRNELKQFPGVIDRIAKNDEWEKLTEEGDRYFENKHYQKAENAYSRAIELNPNNYILYANRSAAWLKLENWVETLKDCESCIALNRSFTKAWLRKAHAEDCLKLYDKAIHSYIKVIELNIYYRNNGIKRLTELVIEHMLDSEETGYISIEAFKEQFTAMSKHPPQSVEDLEHRIKYYKKALKVLSDNEQIQYGIIQELGSLYKELNKRQLSIACFCAGLYLEATLDSLKIDKGSMLGNLAVSYLELGNFEQARKYFLHVLEIDAKTKNKAQTAGHLSNYGILLAYADNYVHSLEVLEIALGFAKETNNKKVCAAVMGNFGLTYRYIGEYQKSIDYYISAIEMSKSIDDKRGVAIDRGNLGLSYIHLKQYPSAIKEILCSMRECPTPDNQIHQIMNFGAILTKTNKLKKAEEVYRNGLKLVEQINDQQRCAILHCSLAQILDSTGRFTEAKEYLFRGREIAKNIEDWFSYLVATIMYGQMLIAARCYKNAIEELTQAESIYEKIWHKLETDQFMVAWGDTEVPVSFSSALERAHVLDGNKIKALEVTEKFRAKALRHALGQYYNDVVLTINIEEMHYYARKMDATLIVFSVHIHHVFIWLIHPNNELTFLITRYKYESDITFSDLSNRQYNLLQEVACRDGVPFTLGDAYKCDPDATEEDFEVQYQAIWASLEPWLPVEPESNIIIIPHGSFSIVPYAALRHEGKYLLDSYTLSLAPSITYLYKSITQLSPIKTDSNLSIVLVVGNPKAPKLRTFQFHDLPNAVSEADMVAEKLSSCAYIGLGASKGTIQKEMSTASIIHFAAHAILDTTGAGDDNYLPGAIVLSGKGTDEYDEVKDCFLSSEEIQKMDLKRTKLVFLNCCRTGLGKLRSEGVLGLGRAFLFAGAQSVVLTLWNVVDTTRTVELVKNFYDYYKKTNSPSKALRSAMLSAKENGYSSKEWAPFYIFGQP